jgi:hypothetical protein
MQVIYDYQTSEISFAGFFKKLMMCWATLPKSIRVTVLMSNTWSEAKTGGNVTWSNPMSLSDLKHSKD